MMSTTRCARPPWVLVALSVLPLLLPPPARACASCGCGDPTLTAIGVEKPFRNRVRLWLQEQVGAHVMGAGAWQEQSLVSRTTLGASWSPTGWLTLQGTAPLVVLRSQAEGHEPRHTVGLGDAELLARFLPLRDRRFSPRHLGGPMLGLKLPTGWRVNDSSGYPAPDDSQPGSGSWDPIFGASYAYFGDRVTLFSSVSYRLTTPGFRGYQRGSALGATAGAQVQVAGALALSFGAELSQTAASTLPGGAVAPDTGGLVVALTPGLLWSPRVDWLVRLAVQLPAVQAWNGAQWEHPMGIAAVIVDL